MASWIAGERFDNDASSGLAPAALQRQGPKPPWRSLTMLVIFFALVGAAWGDDWPQWLGPQRDGVWRETGIVEKFPPEGPPVRWRTEIAAGYAGPAVADGRVYVTDRVVAKEAKKPASPFERGHIAGTDRVLCLNEADGKLLWKHEYDCPYTISYPLGPRTTPVVHEGKVYTLGAEGNLLCLETATGHVVWARDLKKDYEIKAPRWGFSAHPLLDGRMLICMVGGKGSTVVAFDKDNGKEIWRSLTDTEPGYCPPMIYELAGRRQLIVWHPEAVNGLDPESGKVYWSQSLPTYEGMTIPTPRQLGNLLFVTSTGNHTALLRLAAERPLTLPSPPGGGRGKGEGGVEVVWRGNSAKKIGMAPVFATPFVEGGYIYGSDEGGKLCCIKADTGERVWETREPSGGKNAPSADVFIIENGERYFLATEKGDLIIAKLSPEGYQEISRTHLLQPTAEAWGREVVWSHPAFAHRCVYARNDKEIICVSLASPGAN
jgi:outer membrane protein assembly factor BamB